MRLPKKVIIVNRPWKVVLNRKDSCAFFSYKTMTITIGTHKNAEREIFTSFLHEITEISAIERGIRATKCTLQHESNDYIFSADHSSFTCMVLDVATVLSDLLKLE